MARKPGAGGARLPVAKTYKLYIGGQFPRTESGRYFPLHGDDGAIIANVCRASRKDFRNAVVAARGSAAGWAGTSGYLRGQILYRVAEMLEDRGDQFAAALVRAGLSRRRAAKEVERAIDRLVYYAGWADKYTQVLSSVNPVASSHFNFSIPEPMGVVSVIAPQATGLLGLVSVLAPIIAGGNTAVVLASESLPLPAIDFAEVLETSDVPAGVVNILTGYRDELAPQFASHMDVNALVLSEGCEALTHELETAAAGNIKRVIDVTRVDWTGPDGDSPYRIAAAQEIKTTWHPIAS
jgi:acyl-CoA reductase-like NAD-dependent aldehyde dehydrogenase